MLKFPSNTTPAPVNWAKRHSGARRWLVFVAAIVTVLYVLLFLTPQIRAENRRADLFLWLTLPDLLVSSLTGNLDAQHLGIADRVLPFSLAAAWLAVATWIGRTITKPLSRQIGRLEHLSLSCLSGLSLLSTSVLLLGLAGWLNRLAIVGVAIIGAGIAYWASRAGQLAKDQSMESTVGVYDVKLSSQIAVWLWRLVPTCVVVLVACYILGGLMPAFEFDVVEYHLQGPKEFYEAGKVSFVPHNVYLSMPLGTEIHALAMMVWVGGDSGWWLGGMAGKLIIAAYSLLAAALAAGWVSRQYGKTAGWATGAMILATPGSIHVAGCGLVDLALGAYVLATVISLELLRQSKLRHVGELGSSAILVCLFAGSAAACKYTGIVFVALPAMVIALIILGRSSLKQFSIRDLSLCLLALFMTVGPWLGKNILATGNPVYPLASSLFGRGNLSEEQMQRWNAAHRVPRSADGSSYGWHAITGSLQQVAISSEFLPMTIVPLGLLALIAIPLADRTVAAKRTDWLRHPVFLSIVFAAWIWIAWFAFTHRIDRFWLPAIPLAAMVAGVAVHWLLVNGYQSLAGGITLLSTVYGVLCCLVGIQSDSRWLVSYDSLRHDVASESNPLGRLSATIDWTNSNLPEDAKLLLIGQAQAYRFERTIAYATCFNTPIGEGNLKGASSDQQLAWLTENGFTHVLVQWSEIDRYRSPGNYGFSSWPVNSDLEVMVQQGVLKKIDWPIDSRSAELFEIAAKRVTQQIDADP